MRQESVIRHRLNSNHQQVDVLKSSDLINAWETKTGKVYAKEFVGLSRNLSNYASTVLDVKTAIRLFKDLGFTGKVALKEVKGAQYVIFKGYPGQRSIFNATRYLATNPKVVDMAIGKIGAQKSVLSGVRLTTYLIVPLNILGFILDDKKTMYELIGETATDLLKVGIAGALAALAATTVATATTLAAGPLIVAIGVGLIASFGLDALDQQLGVTRTLIKAIEDLDEKTFGKIESELIKVEKRLKWQILNGFPVGQGIFY